MLSTPNISRNEHDKRVFYLPTLADLIGPGENELPFNGRCVTNVPELLIHQGEGADDCRALVLVVVGVEVGGVTIQTLPLVVGGLLSRHGKHSGALPHCKAMIISAGQ